MDIFCRTASTIIKLGDPKSHGICKRQQITEVRAEHRIPTVANEQYLTDTFSSLCTHNTRSAVNYRLMINNTEHQKCVRCNDSDDAGYSDQDICIWSVNVCVGWSFVYR